MLFAGRLCATRFAAAARARSPLGDKRRALQTEALRIHNSLTGGAEPLPAPGPDNLVGWYVCGPTVYDDAHLGHARTYLCFDVIRRVLARHFKVPLLYTMGVTDIDDKIIARAEERGVPAAAVAQEFEHRFFEDMSALGVMEPHARLRVSENVPAIVDYVGAIVDR